MFFGKIRKTKVEDTLLPLLDHLYALEYVSVEIDNIAIAYIIEIVKVVFGIKRFVKYGFLVLHSYTIVGDF